MTQIEKIALGKLHPSAHNAREQMNGQSLKLLAKSIKQCGILVPLAVRKLEGDAGYEVLSGHRRLMAAKIAGLTEAPCMVVKETDAPAFARMHGENFGRVDLTIWEEAAACRTMIEAGKKSAEVCRLLGLKPGELKLRLSLSGLSPEWKEAIRTGLVRPASPRHMEMVARWPLHARQNEMLDAFLVDACGETFAQWKESGRLNNLSADDMFVYSRTSRATADLRLHLALFDRKETTQIVIDGKPVDRRCEGCPRRATRRERELWPEAAKVEGMGFCLDKNCWLDKTALALKDHVHAANESGLTVFTQQEVFGCLSEADLASPEVVKLLKTTVPFWHLGNRFVAVRDSKHTAQVYILTPTYAGEVWAMKADVKAALGCTDDESEPKKEEKKKISELPPEQREAARKERKDALARKRVCKWLSFMLAKAELPFKNDANGEALVNLVTAFGLPWSNRFSGKEHWECLKADEYAFNSIRGGARKVLHAGVSYVLSQRVNVQNGTEATAKWDEVQNILGLLAIDEKDAFSLSEAWKNDTSI